MGEIETIKEEIENVIKDVTDYELLDLVYKLLTHSL